MLAGNFQTVCKQCLFTNIYLRLINVGKKTTFCGILLSQLIRLQPVTMES